MTKAELASSRVVALGLLLILIAAHHSMVTAASSFHPAKYRGGALPAFPPPMVVGGGEVMLELEVTSLGAVRNVKALRTTPPYTNTLITATQAWRFTPAEIENDAPVPEPGAPKFRAVDSTVLVVGMFRAPTLNSPTLGEVPKDVAAESDTTPFPFTTVVPLYPPRARDSGLVLIETTIDANGRPAENRVVRSSQPFDGPVLDALQQWMFRPARIRGSSTPTLAYVIVGFRQPVTGGASVGP